MDSDEASPFPRADIERPITDRFEDLVAIHGEHVAVQSASETLSYEMLNRRANRLARVLSTRPAGAAVTTALLMETDTAAITVMLGVLKAGLACVPLDPAAPESRLRSILDDAQAATIVTSSRYLRVAQGLAGAHGRVLDVAAVDHAIPDGNLGHPLRPDDPAFLMYTSGSTGEPKGVVQDHRAVVHRSWSQVSELGIGSADRVAPLMSFGFSGFLRPTFAALLSGATLCLFDVRERALASIGRWLDQEKISACYSTPSVFRLFTDALDPAATLSSLRLVHLSAESVPRDLVERYRRHCPPSCVLVHGLASNEAGMFREIRVDMTTAVPDAILPVGYAVADKEIMLLDEQGQEVPVGEIGEIFVHSRYLSPGYWRRPDLTAAVFADAREGGGWRTYRTGDLGRLRPDGCLEHLGRRDFQVKIRGQRVQIDQIERVLSDHPGVTEAAVVAREEAGSLGLVAYVVPDRTAVPTTGELRQWLADRLPSAMVPGRFVTMSALPLTPNGKLDRGALPPPGRERPELTKLYRAPRTPVEHELSALWAEVLSVDRIGTDDRFIDLGGNSLLAGRLVARVIESFRIDVPLRTLLEGATVAEMAVTVTAQLLSRLDREDQARLLADVEGTAS